MSQIDTLKERLARRVAEARSRAMTRLANRTFATHPNRVDRIAMAILTKAFPGDDEPDPELDHSHLE